VEFDWQWFKPRENLENSVSEMFRFQIKNGLSVLMTGGTGGKKRFF
jgi:hypothetical protein